MAHQYFDDNRELAHEYLTFETTIHNKPYRFRTDSGVFSRQQMDFGSRLLVETLLEQLPITGDVLDLGCGYGPMGIAVAQEHPEIHVDMVDVSERALELARDNAKLNGVDNVTIQTSDGYETVTKMDYQVILTNPPIRAGKAVVHRFIEEAHDHLTAGGHLVLVIQKKQGAPSAKNKMIETFGNVERIALKKGYWILDSQKK